MLPGAGQEGVTPITLPREVKGMLLKITQVGTFHNEQIYFFNYYSQGQFKLKKKKKKYL